MALLDTLSGTTANAAYSLGRRLRAAYGGAAFRVRRASDSTEQDIGFVSCAVDVASLLTFCAGTDGFLSRIYDQTLRAGISAHRYWRIFIPPFSGDDYVSIAEVTMSDGSGPVSLSTGGAFASSYASTSYVPGNACDGNASTSWANTSTDTPASRASNWWGYDFGSGTTEAIVSFSITVDQVIQTPPAFSFQYSDDGSTWVTASSYTATWSSVGQTRAFAVFGDGADLLQATTAYQPQVVSSGALLNPIAGYPAANGGFMTCTGIVLPSASSTLYGLSATVCTGGSAGARLWSFLASGQSFDFDNQYSCLVQANDAIGTLGAYRNRFYMGDLSAPLNTTIVVATEWVDDSNTTYINGIASPSQDSSGTFGTAGTLNFQHGEWSGGGTGDPWTGRTTEFIVAGVMSPADFTTAQADMIAYYTEGGAAPLLRAAFFLS